MADITLPSERIARLMRSGHSRYETGVPCGPLAAMYISGEWYCIHRASGRQVGGACTSGTAAILLCGALLAMPETNWTLVNPMPDFQAITEAQSRIEAQL
jgi:hypothetical protein